MFGFCFLRFTQFLFPTQKGVNPSEVSTLINSISKLTELKIQRYLPCVFRLLFPATCPPDCIILCTLSWESSSSSLCFLHAICHSTSRASHFKCRISWKKNKIPFKSNILLAWSKSSWSVVLQLFLSSDFHRENIVSSFFSFFLIYGRGHLLRSKKFS